MTAFPGGVLAEFDTPDAMAGAAVALADERFQRITTYAPYDLPLLPARLGRSRTAIPLITLVAGLSGAVFAYWLQWYTAVPSYPLDVGNRPAHAGPAFILITFETAVLCASCAAFLAFFLLMRLPQLWAPVAEIPAFERGSVDRFWVAVSNDDPRFDVSHIRGLLLAHRPLRVVILEDREP